MKCHYFLQKQCHSCDLLALSYLSSVKNKEQTLARLFPDHLDQMKPAIVCDHGTAGTRNKAKLAVTLKENEIAFGFYDSGRQFTALEHCPLHAPAINDVLVIVKKQLSTHHIIPYDVLTKKGELKFLLITYSESAKELLLRFVLRSKESLARLKKLSAELVALQPAIKVITVNIQSTHQAILEGDEEIVLTESDCITHYFDEYSLFQGPRSFFQTHSTMALQLYRQFQHELSALPVTSLLDLYCGVGAFSFFAAKHCQKVVGVEISDAAIHYANQARAINHGTEIIFQAMDVEVFLRDQTIGCFDAMLVNPPRRGLNDAIIANIKRLQPAYLFYSSCNAETLHRDLLQLETQYAIKSLQLFDMFPFTRHFETLAVLCSNSSV